MSIASKPDRGPTIGALVRVAHQALAEQLARWLAESAYDDIQPAHCAAIQPLWALPEGARVTTLARSARITKQSMSALVEHLERRGYVERLDDPDDARASRVRLTARGRAFGRAVRGFGHEMEADWIARLGERRFGELKSILERLRDSLVAE